MTAGVPGGPVPIDLDPTTGAGYVTGNGSHCRLARAPAGAPASTTPRLPSTAPCTPHDPPHHEPGQVHGRGLDLTRSRQVRAVGAFAAAVAFGVAALGVGLALGAPSSALLLVVVAGVLAGVGAFWLGADRAAARAEARGQALPQVEELP